MQFIYCFKAPKHTSLRFDTKAETPSLTTIAVSQIIGRKPGRGVQITSPLDSAVD